MNLDVNIKKQYREFQLDCSIKIPEGRIIGFVGPNGAGKSTTMKANSGRWQRDRRVEERRTREDRSCTCRFRIQWLLYSLRYL